MALEEGRGGAMSVGLMEGPLAPLALMLRVRPLGKGGGMPAFSLAFLAGRPLPLIGRVCLLPSAAVDDTSW